MAYEHTPDSHHVPDTPGLPDGEVAPAIARKREAMLGTRSVDALLGSADESRLRVPERTLTERLEKELADQLERPISIPERPEEPAIPSVRVVESMGERAAGGPGLHVINGGGEHDDHAEKPHLRVIQGYLEDNPPPSPDGGSTARPGRVASSSVASIHRTAQ